MYKKRNSSKKRKKMRKEGDTVPLFSHQHSLGFEFRPQKRRKNMRVGMGYDVHKLVEGRDLIVGGVKIPHTLGLLGHSDADVLLHAIMDALLGAAALGDIGKHFPDTDPQYKGISSIKLLEHVAKLIEEKATWSRTSTRRSSPRNRKCAHTLSRWRRTSQKRSISM